MRKLYIFALLFIASISSNAQVISQIFAGGGNAGSPFTNDYIEIFNNTGSSITLTNYSLQYATSASTTGSFTVVATINTTLAAGQYYLVQLGTTTGSNVTADLTGSNTNLAVGGGKVILVNTNTAIAVAPTGCPSTSVIDFVGYGTANCAEGTAAVAMTNTTALLRAANGCTDANNNFTDLVSGTPAPRNSTTTPSPCGVLPVKFTNVVAIKKANALEIKFSNLTETDVANYNIERSSTGNQFNSIAQIKPRQNNGDQADYSFTDEQPSKGVNFYRIKATEANGKVAYSVIVKINASSTQSGLTIFPNPVKKGQLNFQVTDLASGDYTLSIRNATGQVVYKQSLRNVDNSFSQTVPLNNMKSGMYYLELSGATKMSKQFIIE